MTSADIARLRPASPPIRSSTVRHIWYRLPNLTHKFPDLLRVLRNGIRIKEEVDDAIDKVCLLLPAMVLMYSQTLFTSVARWHTSENLSRGHARLLRKVLTKKQSDSTLRLVRELQ